MRNFITVVLLMSSLCAASQQYQNDEPEAFSAIKNYCFKRGYLFDVAFKNKKDAAIFVKSSTEYLVFCVYDNSSRPVTKYTAYLMTPEERTRKEYTARPQDVGVFKSAGGYTFSFLTPVFKKKDKYPVKLEGNVPTNFYVFFKRKK